VTIVGGEVVYQEGKFHEDVRGTEVTFQDT
jgi:hypothetical protein